MDCRKYKAWINSAAAGALRPSHDTELRAHLAWCEDCRQAFERERNLLAAIDQGVVQMLDAEPSPQMLARIRHRIAAGGITTGNRRWGPATGWLVASAAGVLLAVAGVWAWKVRQPSSARPAPVSSVSSVERALPTKLHAPTIATDVPGSEPKGPAWHYNAKRRVGRVSAGIARRRQTRQPEVLVEKDEAALVLQFYNGLRTGRIEGSSLLKTPPGYKQEADGSLTPAPLKIEPIRIARLDSGQNGVKNLPDTM